MSANQEAALALRLLDRLVGTWAGEATHPAMPGAVIRGTTSFEWLDGGRFLIQRTHMDHPDIPDAICVIGFTGQDRAEEKPQTDGRMTVHYFDSRGVFRLFQSSIDEEAWLVWREAPGFSQRFTSTLADGGNTLCFRTQLRRDDVHWADDLQATYRRDG